MNSRAWDLMGTRRSISRAFKKPKKKQKQKTVNSFTTLLTEKLYHSTPVHETHSFFFFFFLIPSAQMDSLGGECPLMSSRLAMGLRDGREIPLRPSLLLL